MTASHPVKLESEVPLTLRDGTVTYVDILRPDVTGRFPGLLARTPYDRKHRASGTGAIQAIRAVQQGYAVVIQDVRGRFASHGEFDPFVHEINDGYDSVRWVSTQPWCTGKVGMCGISYNAATQLLAAKSAPPALGAITPGMTASDYHKGWAWRSGVFELGFSLGWAADLAISDWDRRYDQPAERHDQLVDTIENLGRRCLHLPMKELPDLQDGLAPFYYDWLDHPEYDYFWRGVSIEESYDDINVPAFHFGGWYDMFLTGTIRNYIGLRKRAATEEARRGQKLVIGPWVHEQTPGSIAGEYSFGAHSSAGAMGLESRLLRFFDYWLKGENNGYVDQKPVEIFVMGENAWRTEDEWPLKRAVDVRHYLHSRGKANTLNGDGLLEPSAPFKR